MNMTRMVYTDPEQLPLTLNARQVADTLGISLSEAYCLLHTAEFPTLKIGRRLLVPKDKLIAWMNRNSRILSEYDDIM